MLYLNGFEWRHCCIMCEMQPYYSIQSLSRSIGVSHLWWIDRGPSRLVSRRVGRSIAGRF